MGISPGLPARTIGWPDKTVLVFIVCISLSTLMLAGGTAIGGEAARPTAQDLPTSTADGIDPITRFLLDDALTQGRISKERHAALTRDYEEQQYLRQPAFKVWYDRGLNLGINDNSFLLRIRTRLVAQYAQRYRNEAWRDPGDGKNFPDLIGVFDDYRVNRSDGEASTVSLRRARFYLMGHVFDPSIKYYVQIRADSASDSSQTQSQIQLYDYFVTHTNLNWANVQVGQYRVYFNRAQITSTAAMQFAERSLVADAFTASGLDRRDIGLTIMNDEEVYPLNYYLGVFGGAGPNFTRLGNFDSEQITQGCPGGQTGVVPIPTTDPNCLVTGPPGNQTNPLQRNLNADTRRNIDRLMFSGRLNWNVMGRPGYGEGDNTYSSTPQFAVGGGYSYNPSVNTSSNNAFIGVDLGSLNVRRLIAAGGNGRELGWGVVDFSTWAVDSVFKYRGFSLQGEVYFKNVIRHEKGRPCVQFAQLVAPLGSFDCTARAPQELGNAFGWYVQSGYYLVPRYVEFAGRYAYWDPDTNSANDLIKEVDLSLNWFVNGTYDHLIQVTFSNIAMGTGGYAIGRSNPMPLVNQGSDVFPNGAIPVDAVGGTLIENTIRVQYQLFF